MVKDPRVLHSLGNSVYLALFTSLFSVVLGLVLAVLVNRLGSKEGAAYRLVLFLPVMLPLAIIGLLFTFLYNPEMGLVNLFLGAVGLGQWKHVWLQEPHLVMTSIAVVGVWRTLGLTMMLAYTGIQMIPPALIESSHLDGASYRVQFFRIILPLILPVISVAAVFTLVLSFKTFDLVYVMTGGGPGTTSETIPLHMVTTAFDFNEYGYSAAMGFVLTVIVMAIILLVRFWLDRDQYEF